MAEMSSSTVYSPLVIAALLEHAQGGEVGLCRPTGNRSGGRLRRVLSSPRLAHGPGVAPVHWLDV
jgi:hypothetical protein